MNESERKRADERWEQRFAELAAYVRVLGHAHIYRGDFVHPKLRTWLKTQRAMAVAGTLSAECWQRLTELGISLVGRDERWQMRFAQLRQFRERFGHCRVSAKWKEDVPFGKWVHVQREFKKKGLLSAARVALLESIGFEWHARWAEGSHDLHWERMCGHLERFAQEHGHAEVPRGYAGVPGLLRWISIQRIAHRWGRLRADRSERLEAIGLVWRDAAKSKVQLWEERFAQLLRFRERFGHCRVAAKWKEDVPFGHWVHVQREFKRKGMLSAERIARLEAAGFEWRVSPGLSNVQRVPWTEMFARLKAWKEQHGSVRGPSRSGGKRLGAWVTQQRMAARNGTLRADRREQLDAIGFDWKGGRPYFAEQWERRFAQLLAFRERHGHCRVPAKWREDTAFGHWVYNQRLFKRTGKLSAERIRRLEEIGFVWKC
jgi:hypothetical protein